MVLNDAVLADAGTERRAPASARRRARVPWRRRVVTAALWSVVVVFGLGYTATLAVPLWFQLNDQRLLIVTSDSMAGAQSGGFEAGDAVLLQAISGDDADQLKVGQVVTFWPLGSETLVTHRIVALRNLPMMQQDPATGRMEEVVGEDGKAEMVPHILTQGDANPLPDPDATPIGRVRGVVLRAYPQWGWVLQWSQSPAGRLALLGPPLAALGVLELLAVLRERRAKPAAAPVRPRRLRPGPPGTRPIDELLLDQ